MPELDVSEILTDPDIADVFTVIRLSTSVSTVDGRAVVKEEVIEGVIGVIMAADPDDVATEEDGRRYQAGLSVTTRFRLRASSPDHHPDDIVWNGGRYTVMTLKSHNRFGVGFVKATAVIRDTTAPAQV